MLVHSVIGMVVGWYNFTFYIFYPYYQVTLSPSCCRFNIIVILACHKILNIYGNLKT